MSVARIMSGVFAGSVTSTTAALEMTRKEPPVPLMLSWQPEPAQVLIELTLPWWIGSCAWKTG